MATIVGTSELVRQAVAHIFATRKEHPERTYDELLDEAAMRFNLSPLDCEALRHTICQSDKEGV